MTPLTRDATAARLATIAFTLYLGWLLGPLLGAPKVFGTACFWAAAMAALFAGLCSWDHARRWLDKQVQCRHEVRNEALTLLWEDQALRIANGTDPFWLAFVRAHPLDDVCPDCSLWDAEGDRPVARLCDKHRKEEAQ